MLTLEHANILKVARSRFRPRPSSVRQIFGVSLSCYPWMLAMEFMENKDLRSVLRTCKNRSAPLRLQEMLHFAVQMTAACVYLSEVSRFRVVAPAEHTSRNASSTATFRSAICCWGARTRSSSATLAAPAVCLASSASPASCLPDSCRHYTCRPRPSWRTLPRQSPTSGRPVSPCGRSCRLLPPALDPVRIVLQIWRRAIQERGHPAGACGAVGCGWPPPQATDGWPGASVSYSPTPSFAADVERRGAQPRARGLEGVEQCDCVLFPGKSCRAPALPRRQLHVAQPVQRTGNGDRPRAPRRGQGGGSPRCYRARKGRRGGPAPTLRKHGRATDGAEAAPGRQHTLPKTDKQRLCSAGFPARAC